MVRTSLGFALLLIFTSFSAQAEQVIRGEVLEYGFYQNIKGFERVRNRATPTGYSRKDGRVRLIKQTKQIPMLKGLLFGFRFRISGFEQKSNQLWVRLVVKHPLMVRPNGSRTEGYSYPVAMEIKNGVIENKSGYSFDQDFEMVKGPWRFQYWIDESLVLDQIFQVRDATAEDVALIEQAKQQALEPEETATAQSDSPAAGDAPRQNTAQQSTQQSAQQTSAPPKTNAAPANSLYPELVEQAWGSKQAPKPDQTPAAKQVQPSSTTPASPPVAAKGQKALPKNPSAVAAKKAQAPASTPAANSGKPAKAAVGPKIQLKPRVQKAITKKPKAAKAKAAKAKPATVKAAKQKPPAADSAKPAAKAAAAPVKAKQTAKPAVKAPAAAANAPAKPKVQVAKPQQPPAQANTKPPAKASVARQETNKNQATQPAATEAAPAPQQSEQLSDTARLAIEKAKKWVENWKKQREAQGLPTEPAQGKPELQLSGAAKGEKAQPVDPQLSQSD